MNKNERTYKNTLEFYIIVKDLLDNETVKQMKQYRQHFDTSCYSHCLEVAYWSYLFCKRFNLDYASCARAGMLHDLFLYDWRGSKKRLHLKHYHAFAHPQIALENAQKITTLNEVEKDIIVNHMWPVTFFRLPKYKETFVITVMDKLSALNSFRTYYAEKVYSTKIYKYAYILIAGFIFNIF